MRKSRAKTIGVEMSQRKVFTMGQISEICSVSCRLVQKWVDSGKMTGYRLPLSQDRRVTRAALISFLKANGFPVPLALDKDEDRLRVLCVGCMVSGLEDYLVVHATTCFEAGLVTGRAVPAVAVVDCTLGRSETMLLARQLRGAGVGRIIGISAEDEADMPAFSEAFDIVLRSPVDPQSLVAVIREVK